MLEAYQVEVRYGRDVEAYSGLHSIAGVEREVDFLRIGRTALFIKLAMATCKALGTK